MISEKNKCIGELSVYGDLKCLLTTEGIFIMDCEFDIPYQAKEPLTVTNILIGDNHFDIELTHESGWSIGVIESYEYLPILHPISNLTKEITHKGYNDDKPFIPLVELAKAYRPNCINYRMRGNDCVICEYSSHGVDYRFNEYSEKGLNLIKEEFDLLHQWHFDTRGLIESGEAVDVNTLDKNPYSI